MSEDSAHDQAVELLAANLEKFLTQAPEFLTPRQSQGESPVMGPFRGRIRATIELVRQLQNADLHILALASVAELNEQLASLVSQLQNVRPLVQHSHENMAVRETFGQVMT